MGIVEHIIERLAGTYIADRIALAVKENDAAWALLYDRVGPSDRPYSERQDSLADALEAWRVNPLARRIVALTTDYVVGGGITHQGLQTVARQGSHSRRGAGGHGVPVR